MPRLNNLGVLSLLLLLFLCRPSASVSFLRGENALNRADAASYCATKGASLASIINQADFDAATTACSSNSCWIGLQQSQENAWGWEWDNAAPVTNFGFDYDWDSTSPPPTAGVSPWAADQPLASNLCVTLDGGFRSSDCGPETVHYPLCSRAKWVVLLDHKGVSAGFFSSEFLSTGIENENDPTANAFSIIGKQPTANGQQFRNGGLFYFKLNWKDISSNDEGAPVIWSQTTWPLEAASNADSQSIRYTPEWTVGSSGYGGLVRAWMPHQFDFGAYLADELGNIVGVTKDDGRADTNGIPTLSNEWASSQTLSVYMGGDTMFEMTNLYWTGFEGTWYATGETSSNDYLCRAFPIYTKIGYTYTYGFSGHEWYLFWHTDGWYIGGDVNAKVPWGPWPVHRYHEVWAYCRYTDLKKCFEDDSWRVWRGKWYNNHDVTTNFPNRAWDAPPLVLDGSMPCITTTMP